MRENVEKERKSNGEFVNQKNEQQLIIENLKRDYQNKKEELMSVN